MTEAKKHNIFWPSVKTLEDAKKAAGYGTGAAIVVAAVTAAFATWALVSKSTVIGFVDAWAYVDAVLFSGTSPRCCAGSLLDHHVYFVSARNICASSLAQTVRRPTRCSGRPASPCGLGRRLNTGVRRYCVRPR
jgi:hypothetical protein